jgi:hypothetical protein
MNHNTRHLKIVIGLSVWLGVMVLVSVGLVLQPKGKPNCNSFGSYDDILSAFNNGATYLDADKDRIPCESRKPAV